MSTRISYWTVTSSAVVGSSRTSSGGLRASAAAIITRWRMPPDSWCDRSLQDGVGARDPDHVEQPARLGARVALRQLAAAEVERLEELGLDGQDRVEPGQRALRDVADGAAADRLPVLLVGARLMSWPAIVSRPPVSPTP